MKILKTVDEGKIVEEIIDCCGNCDYCDCDDYDVLRYCHCDKTLEHLDFYEIDEKNKFPEFCPLEDAE